MTLDDHKIDLLEKIDHYLAGELTEKERFEFEKQIKEDAALAEEVKFQKMLNFSIANKESKPLKDHLTQTNKILMDIKKNTAVEHGEEKTGGAKVVPLYSRMLRFAAAAAVIALLLVPAYFFLQQGPDAEKLFAENYQPYSPAARGAVEDENVNEVIDLYMRGYNKQALKVLNGALDANPNATVYYFYRGLVNIELKNLDEASDDFTRYVAGDGEYKNDALWYLSLTHIAQKKFDESEPYLNELASSRNQYSKRAKKLLENMDLDSGDLETKR